MSDYLSRLIEDAQTDRALIRPRQPQPFEKQPFYAKLAPFSSEGKDHSSDVPPIIRKILTAQETLPVLSTPTPDRELTQVAEPADTPTNHPIRPQTLRAPKRSTRTIEPAKIRPVNKVNTARSVTDQTATDKTHVPPIIRVTIGRIEVRASLPVVPATTAPPKQSKPVISLDDYLNSRRGKGHE
jgi:hypothetical protein